MKIYPLTAPMPQMQAINTSPRFGISFRYTPYKPVFDIAGNSATLNDRNFIYKAQLLVPVFNILDNQRRFDEVWQALRPAVRKPIINFSRQTVVFTYMQTTSRSQPLTLKSASLDQGDHRRLTLVFDNPKPDDRCIGIAVMGTAWNLTVVDKDTIPAGRPPKVIISQL